MVTGDGAKLLYVGGGGNGEQPYYDSFVRNKLHISPANKASLRLVTNCGPIAKILKTGDGLSV